MNIVNSFSHCVYVNSCDIGPEQRIKIRPLLHYLQEAAVGHSNQAGDTFSKQLRQGKVWVLTRLHLQLERIPAWEEEVTIHTWSYGTESIYALREFSLANDEHTFGAATSQWVMIDTKKRRPVRLSSEQLEGYGIRQERMIQDPFEPLPSINHADREIEVPVLRGHLDSLNHVNNAFYAEWCFESLPEKITGARSLQALEIAFRKEALYGDRLISQTQRKGDLFLHRLVRHSDQSEIVVARSRWFSS